MIGKPHPLINQVQMYGTVEVDSQLSDSNVGAQYTVSN